MLNSMDSRDVGDSNSDTLGASWLQRRDQARSKFGILAPVDTSVYNVTLW